MGTPEGAQFAIKVKVLLKTIDLPPLSGPWIAFGDEEHFIVAKLDSIGYGAGEGIKLYISAKRLRGKDIKCLKLSNGKWFSVSENNQVEQGQFIFL